MTHKGIGIWELRMRNWAENAQIRKWLQFSFYGSLALTLNTLVLLRSTVAFGQFISPDLRGASLEEQLDIPLNNGIRGPNREQADFLLRVGAQAQQRGFYEKAIANWLQALDLYQQIGDLEGEGLTQEYLGVAYGKLGRYIKAEDAFRRRVGIARTRRDFQGQIYGLNNLGTVLLESGNPDAAQKTFEEALTIARSVGNQRGEGLSLSNLGLAAAAKGNYYEAIKRYETALGFRSLVGNPLGEANTRNNLGDVNRVVKRYRDALIAYQGGLRASRESGDISNQFRALRGLVQSYKDLGQYPVALKILEQHKTLAQQQSNLREQLLSLRFAAELNKATGNLADARAFYQEAIALAGALGDTQEQAFLRNDLAQILYTLPRL